MLKQEDEQSREYSDQEMNLDQEDQESYHDANPENIQRDYQRLKINLKIEECDSNGKSQFTEMIRNFEVQNYIANEQKDLILSDLIEGLKAMDFNLTGIMIYYYCGQEALWIFCGYDPLPGNILIPAEDYLNLNELTLKFRQNPIGLIHQIMTEETYENKQKTKDQNVIREENTMNKCRRTKERKIGFIIQKVVEWRRLYNGTQDENGKSVRYSLEDAAKQVNISKKSLDDYLLQIRFGKKYGFNFNEHHNEKVGVLRAFVKKEKNKNSDKEKQKKTKPNKKKPVNPVPEN